MRPIRTLALTTAVALTAVTGCSLPGGSSNAAPGAAADASAAATTGTAATDVAVSTGADLTYDNATTIELTGSSAKASSSSVSISGSTVTITAPGTYAITCQHQVVLAPTTAGAPWPDHGHEAWDLTLAGALTITVA